MITDIGGNKSLIQYEIDKTPREYAKTGGMDIGGLHVKPILLYLSDTQSWVDKWELAKQHLDEQGFTGIYHLNGIHAKEWGIQGRHSFLLDGRPEEQHYVGDGNVGNYLSQYAAYLVLDALDYSHGLYLEGDARFKDGWKEEVAQALIDIGTDDWDILFLGSCCCAGKGAEHVKGNVWHFPYRGKDKWMLYPLCTHAYIINKRCIKHMIATNRDVANNTDISMQYNSFPKMKVYAILPRLADQFQNNLPE